MKRCLLCLFLLAAALLGAEEFPLRQAYKTSYSRYHFDSPDGGKIVFWTDNPQGHANIFAQKIAPSGETLWADPLAVVVNPGDQRLLDAVTATDGNFIILWGEYDIDLTFQLRLQKLDANGQRLWPLEGVAVYNPELNLAKAVLAPNAAGGAFVVYANQLVPGIITGQNFAANGDPLWPLAGTDLFTYPHEVVLLGAVSDGEGGLIVNLSKNLNNYPQNHLIRFSSQAEIVGNNPLVNNNLFPDLRFELLPGAPGRFILWQQYNEPERSIRCRQINNLGNLLPFEATQYLLGDMIELSDLKLARTTEGGLVLAWAGSLPDFSSQLRIQKFSPTFLPLWPGEGVELASGSDHVFSLSLDVHPNGNAWLAWDEWLWEPPASSYFSKAQLVLPAGVPAWEPGGKLLSQHNSSPTAMGWDDRGLFLWLLLDEGNLSVRRQVFSSAGIPCLAEGGLPLVQQLFGQASLRDCVALQDRWFCVWSDQRTGPRVYYQILDQNLNCLLEPAGRPMPAGIDVQALAKVGGNAVAILSYGYVDDVYTFFVQLIDANGNCLYPGSGILLSFATGGWANDLALDSFEGDIYLTWVEASTDYEYFYIKGQRIHDGQLMWEPTGRVLMTYESDFYPSNPRWEGNYLVWRVENYSAGLVSANALLFDANGNPAAGWAPEGVELVVPTGSVYNQSVVSSGLVEGDLRAFIEVGSSLRAQRINPQGQRLWTDNGVQLQSPGGSLYLKDAVYASGTAFLMLETAAAGDQLLFQEIGADGVLRFPGLGNTVATGLDFSSGGQLLGFADGTWLSAWTGTTGNLIESRDVFIRQLSPDGVPLGAGPTVLCDARYAQYALQGAALGNRALLAWNDDRAGIMNSEQAYTGIWANSFTSAWTPVAAEPLPPVAFALGANFPNPFNPSTAIPFSLPVAGPASLGIYNLKGQLVRNLCQDEFHSAGNHCVTWDGRDGRGQPVGSGIYFYRLNSSGKQLIRKMVLTK